MPSDMSLISGKRNFEAQRLNIIIRELRAEIKDLNTKISDVESQRDEAIEENHVLKCFIKSQKMTDKTEGDK